MKLFQVLYHLGLMISAALLGTSVAGAQDVDSKKIRVVDADAHVQSHKRGICANHMSAEDFKAIAPGVSWFYNWHYKTDDLPPKGVNVEFVPMCWGDTQDRLDGLEKYLSTASKKPRAVLAINEPNLKGQAFIPPEQTAKLYMKITAIADKHGVPTVGPHMALGSATGDSISAMDPIENKQVTYTFMVPFLKAFLHYLDPNDVQATAFHSYGALGEMNWAVNMMGKEFNRPVWVTEYAQWNTPNDAAALEYLIRATDLLERTENVPAYAWFKERVGDNKRISLFDNASGKLTAMGRAYVALPVHDADVYYRLPGKLPAANYVAMKDMEISASKSRDAMFEMSAEKNGATIDYNVQVSAAGEYTVRFITAGKAGDLSILTADGQTLAEVKKDEKNPVVMTLQKGPQTLRVSVPDKGTVIVAMDVKKK